MFILVKTLYPYGKFFTCKVVSSPATKYMSVTWEAVGNFYLFIYFYSSEEGLYSAVDF